MTDGHNSLCTIGYMYFKHIFFPLFAVEISSHKTCVSYSYFPRHIMPILEVQNYNPIMLAVIFSAHAILILTAFFTRPFYKLLLDKPVTLSDMQSMDMEMHNSVQYILDNDPEDLCLTFTVTKDYLGQVWLHCVK